MWPNLWRDIESLDRPVTLLTVTEFGRRLAENGSLGTDHGLASVGFVLGHRVAGGRVYGRWPGLQTEQLSDGMDLTVTTDYRHLLNEYTASQGRSPLFSGLTARAPLGVFV